LKKVKPIEGISTSLVLTDQQNGASVSISPGQNIELFLASNPSTGYSWQIVSNDLLTVVSDDSISNHADVDKVGAEVTQHWILKPEAPGNTQLNLWYMQPWESTQPVKTFGVKIAIKS